MKKVNQEKFYADISKKKLRLFLNEENFLKKNLRNRLEESLKKGPMTNVSKPKILPKRHQSTIEELQSMYAPHPDIPCDNYWEILNRAKRTGIYLFSSV